MYKAFAMLQDRLSVFIIGYTLWAVPWNVGGLAVRSAQPRHLPGPT